MTNEELAVAIKGGADNLIQDIFLYRRSETVCRNKTETAGTTCPGLPFDLR